MLLTEWNWDTALEVSKEEGMQQGIQQGIQQGMQQGIQQGTQDLIKFLDSGHSLEEAKKKFNFN